MNEWKRIDYEHPPSIYDDKGKFIEYETMVENNGIIKNLTWNSALKKFNHGFFHIPSHWREKNNME